MLNSQFANCFTKEDCSSMLQMGPDLSKTAPPLIIQEEAVKKFPDSQNPHKASGLDQITPRFLKEIAASITPALTLIFQTSYDQCQVPVAPRTPLSSLLHLGEGALGSSIV